LTTTILELAIGIIVILVLAAIAVNWKAIDIEGAVAGSVITFIAFLAGGYSWLIMIVIFFGVSSALTKYRYDYKRVIGSAQDKFGTRSWPNSVANGGVAAIASAGELLSHSELLSIMFLSSVTVALSDTLATEVGLLSRTKPRFIINPTKTVEAGTSGGVSPLGQSVAIVSAISLSIVGSAIGIIKEPSLPTLLDAVAAVVIGALLGVLFDSVLGASIQGINKCVVCNKLTESFSHHGQKAETIRGIRYFDNNVVNFVSILGGSLCSVGIYLLIIG
jgi:uncharacterized protein (TIGR00297 family)